MVKAPTHPAGEDPRRLRALWPSSLAQPTKLPPGWVVGGAPNSPPEPSGLVGAAFP